MPPSSCRKPLLRALGCGLCALLISLSAACDPPPKPAATRDSAQPGGSVGKAASAQPDGTTAGHGTATGAAGSAQPGTAKGPGSASGASSGNAAAGNSAAADSSAAPDSSGAFDPDALAGMTEPPLFGPDGKLLEQTKDEPSVESAVFRERLSNLFRAIQQNDPEIARSFFFPVQAYEKVKAIDKAAADWRWRLFGRFKRDIKKYHKRLGDEPDKAKLLRIELRRKPEWMKPGREGNLLGYYRVTRSWLHYETAEGKERHFEVTSMISWRGEWYVVHLHGFK